MVKEAKERKGMIRWIYNHTVVELPWPEAASARRRWCLCGGKTTCQALQPFLLAQCSLHVLSAKKEQTEGMFSLKINLPMLMRSPQHGTQMDNVPVIFRRITLHSSSQSAKLISWRKQSPGWLGYTLMPTLTFPVVLTACETSREMQPGWEMLTSASDTRASEIWCQVKERVSRPGQLSISQEKVKDFGEKHKTK